MLNQTFSVKNRENQIQNILDKELDLIVIGGGITGAGITLDAQSRGAETLLLEMQDFAAGTSSRSTKLVHGGLRYLKQLEIGLVAEVGKERAIVYENGPHVTTPEWMLLPIIEGGTFGKFSTSVGLSVYDRLAGVRKTERRKMLSKEETLKREPLLKEQGLKGSGYYVEYRTDDARLTLEVLKKAYAYGASLFNYMKVTDFIYKNNKLVGVKVTDRLTNQTYDLYAKKIVNATGPWVDDLREIDGSKKGKHLYWTKGIHIVIDQSKCPLSHAVYFDVEDGRMIFAIPRAGKTYIGTTDTEYHGDLEHPRLTQKDRDYLIEAVNQMFPKLHLSDHDIESGWAGIRPLIHEEGKSPSEISRKDEVFRSESGLITIAGGKLTGYRKMAQKIVDLVTREIGEETGNSFKNCHTHRISISGGDVGGVAQWDQFLKQKEERGIELGLSQTETKQLTQLYGSNIDTVYQYLESNASEASKNKLNLAVYAMVKYAIDHEMTVRLSDFFIRRTGALFFNIDWVQKWKQEVAQFMAKELNWNNEQLGQNLNELQVEISYSVDAAKE
ncbi:glycerol-3-phosphate dehydrogenase/oxidase [Hazenella sp. IB182357]|uniref:Glycerol-3-phosphate dehydrogenase n=1 Tax=Polycladospora coralii TaxID=2771432 RepID=A0A926N8D9_9BACL|nr:glycerol-3-phosphate dehydrogenase/oxidase [Polycladospora coralii]MBD1373946.1 glycerol-3-phosphate dehydrogenase/oxidase [Polycladospora coralii]